MSISRSDPLFPVPSRVLALNFNLPFLLLFLGIPLGMGLLYLPVAIHYVFGGAGVFSFFLRADCMHFFLGHILILAFWIANTFMLCLVLETLLAPWGSGWVLRWVPLVPAASYYLLFVIYISATVGYVCWGYLSNYSLVWTYLGDFSHLVDLLMIPYPLFVLSVIAPLALLVFLFAMKSQVLIGEISRFKSFIQQGGALRRRTFWGAFLVSWLLLVLNFNTGFSDAVNLGHFSRDPVVGFLNPGSSRFQVNAERRQWEQKDLLAERTLRRRNPQVRTVILFVVDSLRADHLKCYGYDRPTSPFLDELARFPGYRKIDQALANGSETTTGVMSILASKEPKTISDSNYTLPDYFHDHGFKTHLMLAGDHRWYLFNRFFGRKIDDYVDGTQAPGPMGVDDDRLLLERLDRLEAAGGGRHFFYFHLMCVHELGYLQDAYRRWEPMRSLWGFMPGSDGTGVPEEIQGRINRYDNGVLQADGMLRQILEKLRAKGYLENYAAVLTADHGQMLGEKGRFGHCRYTDPGLLRVPLIFFGNAELRSFPDKRFAVQLDIAPTLADWAGLEIPFSWQGQSLFRPRTNAWSYHFSPSREFGSEGAVVCYGKGRILKYSRRLTGKSRGAENNEALYDILLDPGESSDLAGEKNSAFLEEFRRRAQEHFVLE